MTNKKNIKIKFVGFWPEFDEKNNFIIDCIKEKYQVILSENPEYVISSCFSEEHLKYNCVKIFYTGENICPDFNAFDYAIGYEYLKYEDRYIRFPNYLIPEVYASDYELMLNKHNVDNNILEKKKDFCSFVVSKGNGYVDAAREELFRELSKYKKVNSGGRYLNNIGFPNGVSDKLDFQKKHKFVIASENSSHSGYTTEKIVQAFAAQAIPIYWGNPNVGKVFNEEAFINCHKFSSFTDVVEQVKKIDEDDMLYLEMLRSPALHNMKRQEEHNTELGLFLDNIFKQDITKAYRRDYAGYGKKYCDELRTHSNIRHSFLGKIVWYIKKNRRK